MVLTTKIVIVQIKINTLDFIKMTEKVELNPLQVFSFKVHIFSHLYLHLCTNINFIMKLVHIVKMQNVLIKILIVTIFITIYLIIIINIKSILLESTGKNISTIKTDMTFSFIIRM